MDKEKYFTWLLDSGAEPERHDSKEEAEEEINALLSEDYPPEDIRVIKGKEVDIEVTGTIKDRN